MIGTLLFIFAYFRSRGPDQVEKVRTLICFVQKEFLEMVRTIGTWSGPLERDCSRKFTWSGHCQLGPDLRTVIALGKLLGPDLWDLVRTTVKISVLTIGDGPDLPDLVRTFEE